MRLRRLIVLAIAISIAAITLVIFYTSGSSTLGSLLMANPVYLLIATAIHAFTWVIWGARIKVLSKVVGGKISLRNAANIVVCSLLPAAVTPSHIGGEATRIYLLNKNGISYGDATAITLGERVLDAFALFGALPIGWFVFREVLSGSFVLSTIFCSTALLFAVLAIVFIYLVIRAENAERFLKYFLRSEKWSKKIGEEVVKFRNGLMRLFTHGKKALALGFACTVAFWLLEFIVPSFILIGFGFDPSWAYSMAAQTILIVFILVPITPGGSGMMELITFALYGAMGVPPLILGVFILTWRFITYHANIIISAIFDIKILKDIDKLLK